MKYSIVLKCSMAVLIALTLGLKLKAKPDDSEWLLENTVRFLEAQQFQVVKTDVLFQGMPILEANSGECHLVVMRVSSVGWNRVMIQGVAHEGDSVFTVFEGAVYPEQPRWQTLISYYRSRILWQLGLTEHTSYVLSVVASARCNAQSLPWRDLPAQQAPAS